MDEPKNQPLSAFYIPTIVYGERGRERAMDPVSMLLTQRIIFVQGEIHPDMAAIITAQLLILDSEDPDKEICMYIQSPGGQITAGLAIVDTMRFIRAPIQTICIGQCASMAAWILAAGTKGRRMMLPNAEVMIHQPLGGSRGQATDMEIANDHIQATKKRMTGMLVELTGQPRERVQKDLERDKYMTAQESLDYGIIDEVIKWRVPAGGSEPARGPATGG